MFETNGLKGMYFQGGVETERFQRWVEPMSTCTAPYRARRPPTSTPPHLVSKPQRPHEEALLLPPPPPGRLPVLPSTGQPARSEELKVVEAVVIIGCHLGGTSEAVAR